MGQLLASGLTFHYGDSLIFQGVNLTLAPGKGIGLVGPNGCGKSTLLRVLARLSEPSKGTISLTRGSRVALLEQDVLWNGSTSLLDAVLSFDGTLPAIQEELRVLEASLADGPVDADVLRYGELQSRFEILGGYDARHRAEKCLAGLGLYSKLWAKPVSELSGGQQRRATLAQVLVMDADILLLDEPTNYLDIWGRCFLEELLRKHKGSFLVVSHDRYFLDSVSDSIAELEGRKLTLYKGNYSAFLPQRELARAKAEVTRKRVEEEKARLRDYVQRNIAGQRHAQAESRRKRLVKIENELFPELMKDKKRLKLDLVHSRREGKVVLKINDLSIERGGIKLFGGLDLRLERGEKIAILGKNGSGKTSLLLALMGKLDPSAGEILWGHNVDVAFLPQENRPEELGKTPFEAVEAMRFEWTAGTVRSYLARFLFFGDHVFQPVVSLSGGERSRLALACLLLSKANVLILDEPTNHLDLDSKAALEDGLLEYDGTIIMVTHDRQLITRLAEKAIVIGEDEIKVVLPPFEKIWTGVGSLPEKKREVHKKKSPRRRTVRRKRSPEAIEKEIVALEEQVEELKMRQADPELAKRWEAVVQVYREQQELERQIETLLMEWEEAAG